MGGNFDLKIGFKCNNNCKHCVVAEKRSSGELTLSQLKRIVDEIPEDFNAVTITGGEPSISPLLFDILKYIKNKGYSTIIQTNGTGFSNKQLVKKCVPYIDHVHIAIHSSDPKIHDFIVGSTGMWRKTMKGFANLLKANSEGASMCLTTQTVLSNYNIDSLYDTYSYIQNLSPGIIMSMTYPHMMGNAYKYKNEVCFRYSDHKDMIQKCLSSFGSCLFVESIPPCYLLPYEKEVISTVEYDIINSLNEKRLHRDSGSNRIGVDFSNGFEIKDYNYLDCENRKKAPLCKSCVFQHICLGVWKEYIDLYKDKLDLYPVTKEDYLKAKKDFFKN